MKMIERVALNIANAKRAKHDIPPCRWEHLTDEGQAEYRIYARAAIEALHEPTDDMAEAIWAKTGDPCWKEDAVLAWKAGINAALTT